MATKPPCEVPGGDEAAARQPRVVALDRGDGEARAHRERGERRGLDARLGPQEGKRISDQMSRRERFGQVRGLKVADIAIGRRLPPGPPVFFVVDGEDLTEQELAGLLGLGGRSPPQRRDTRAHLTRRARHETPRLDPAAQRRRREVVAIGMYARIERRGHRRPRSHRRPKSRPPGRDRPAAPVGLRIRG